MLCIFSTVSFHCVVWRLFLVKLRHALASAVVQAFLFPLFDLRVVLSAFEESQLQIVQFVKQRNPPKWKSQKSKETQCILATLNIRKYNTFKIMQLFNLRRW